MSLAGDKSDAGADESCGTTRLDAAPHRDEPVAVVGLVGVQGAKPPARPEVTGRRPLLELDPETVKVAGWLAEAERIVALTGAGISTDSGIPDFRGPDGMWTRDPDAARLFTLDAYVADSAVRRQAWRIRREHAAWVARPNAGHRALVALERAGRLHAIITQNIDGLHQLAGNSPDRVIEIHGTIFQVECLHCGDRSAMAIALDRLAVGEEDPDCLRCGGLLKAATVSFGQQLDRATLHRAVAAAVSADVLLAVGTSLSVHPAAGLVDYAAGADARIVIVNAAPTPYDAIADAVLRAPIGAVLPALTQGIAGRAIECRDGRR